MLGWTDARDKCISDGGTLAILEPVEKLEFLILHFRTNPTGLSVLSLSLLFLYRLIWALSLSAESLPCCIVSASTSVCP